jgi:hypothetical protein
MPDETEMARDAVKLLDKYIGYVNAYGGDSIQVHIFLHDHENNPKFLQLVAERNSRPQPEAGGSK